MGRMLEIYKNEVLGANCFISARRLTKKLYLEKGNEELWRDIGITVFTYKLCLLGGVPIDSEFIP